jgi:ABC-type transporter Mla subunit MlaD
VSDRKNVIVGLFVLGGAILLGIMIVQFKTEGIFLRGGYDVRGHLPSAWSIRGGKRVHMDGVEIGHVCEVTSSQPRRHGVWITMRINPDVRIPRDAILVAQQSTVGDLYLDFQTPTEVRGTITQRRSDPASDETVIRCTFANGILLRPGNAVRIGGKQVGSVETVAPCEKGQPGIRVGLRLNAAAVIPDDAQVVAKKPGAGKAWVEFQPPAAVKGTVTKTESDPASGQTLIRCAFPDGVLLQPGSAVRIGGKQAGSVETVAPRDSGQPGIRVGLRLNAGIVIPDQAQVVTKQPGVGKAWVEFQPPAALKEGTLTESGIDDASGEVLIRCTFPEGVLLKPGSAVRIGGKQVGSVETVAPREKGQPGVGIGLRLQKGTIVPARTQIIATKPGVGEAGVEFRPCPYLTTDGKAEVNGVVKAPELLPEDLMTDFREAMGKFGQLDAILNNVQEFTDPRTLKDVEAGKQMNLWTVLEQVQRSAKTMQVQMEKPTGEIGGLIADARKAAQALQKAMEKAAKTLDTVDEAGKTIQQGGKKVNALVTKGDAFIAKLAKDTDEAKKLVQNLNALVTDVRSGKGTFGKLVTDDELHRALVTLIENLKTTTDNINRLAVMWRQEGVLSKEGK